MTLKDSEKRNSFWQKRSHSFYYAGRGVYFFFLEGVHAKIHGLATIVVICLGLYFEVSAFEWIVLMLSCTLVLCAEALNTAIEKLTDLVSPNHNPKAGFVKDVAAGAVLLAAMGAAVVGCFIFLPKIFHFN